MTELRKIDDELYNKIYFEKQEANDFWNSIKTNDELLAEAIKVEKDKFRERDLVKGLAICDCMLIDYESVNQEIYQELVNTIYSNIDIARTVLRGASNGGDSYLLMTLWNHDLKLTEEQKQFAVIEAMNKIGTVKFKKEQEDFSKQLDDMGISDEVTTILDIDGCKNPVSAKTGSEYLNYMFATLSSAQAHGEAPFDIRYQILRNPNWTIEEKQKLVYDFWEEDETYDEYLDRWEYDIINDHANFKGNSISQLDKCELYDYTYNDLLKFYNNDRETADRIWKEIIFCQSMHELRPQQWEKEEIPNQKTI